MSDLVSRQAAIKNAHFPMIDDAGYEVVRVDDILTLPSAEPKTGKWVEIENGEYLCSNCLHITIGYPPSNCPNCGSFNGG